MAPVPIWLFVSLGVVATTILAVALTLRWLERRCNTVAHDEVRRHINAVAAVCPLPPPLQAALDAAGKSASIHCPRAIVPLHVLGWAVAQEKDTPGAVKDLSRVMKEWMDARSGFGGVLNMGEGEVDNVDR